jgi:integrase
MPKKAKELLPVQVKRLTRPGFYAVGGVAGLHLRIKYSGARSWILRAKIGDQRRDIGLGGYPDVTLRAAHDSARKAREQIRQGIDPVEARREAQEALKVAAAKQISFDEAAAECFKVKSREFRNPKHAAQWKNTLDTYASPIFGNLPVAQVELAHIVRALEPIWTTKTETASRLRGRIETVLAWATVRGFRTGDNPAQWRGNLDHLFSKPSKIRKVQHHAALPWQQIGGFIVELRKREGMASKALEFLILTASRSGEVRLAKWDEIDLDAKLWSIPAERMKAEKDHRVPLSAPAVKLLKALPKFMESDNVFSAPRGGPLSDATISAVCRRMKVEAVPHGFRSTFKDWCRSSTSYADEVSELALAHVSSDATRAAYARDELLPKRTRLMRDWARFCNTSQSVAEVVPISNVGSVHREHKLPA